MHSPDAEKTSRMPTDFSPDSNGAARMERMPSARQLSRSTRTSSSVSSQWSSGPGLHALPRKTRAYLQARADGGSIRT